MQKYRSWLVFLGGTLLFFNTQTHFPLEEKKDAQNLPIIVIGGAMCDFFLELYQPKTQTEQEPGYIRFEEGKKISLKTLICHTGGGGLNAALAICALGKKAHLFAKIGADSNGERIKKELHDAGVETTLLRDDNHYTGTSFILPSSHGNNTILMSRGANRHLLIDISQLKISPKTYAGVYLAPLSGESTKSALVVAQAAKKAHIPIMCNPSSEQIEKKEQFFKLLPYIDILLINETEAAAIAQQKNCDADSIYKQILLAKQLLSYGPHICIITNGSRGALCVTPSKIFHQEPLPVAPKKTVGAGDTFGATFFNTILLGYSIKKALLYGTLNSSSILSQKVPHAGLLNIETLQKAEKDTLNLPICNELQ